jgi:hypothetical protein
MIDGFRKGDFMRSDFSALLILITIISSSNSCVKIPSSESLRISNYESVPGQENESQRMKTFNLPIIDAHSQITIENLENSIRLMDGVGVTCSIFSPALFRHRSPLTSEKLISFAKNHILKKT